MARLEDEGWDVAVEDAPDYPGEDTPVLIYSATRPCSDGETHDISR
jgi:hypothetical protein